MRTIRDLLWTWLLPDIPHDIDEKEWIRKGGKWRDKGDTVLPYPFHVYWQVIESGIVQY